MNADRKSIWSLIGEILEDIHRIGAGLAVVGLLTDFSVSAAIAVFHDKVIDNYPLLSLGKDILETPALLRDIMGIFLSTLPLTIAISLIAARPKEFLTPLPLGAGWALVLAVLLGDLFGEGSERLHIVPIGNVKAADPDGAPAFSISAAITCRRSIRRAPA